MDAVGMVLFAFIAIVAVWRGGVWRDRYSQAEGVAAAVQAALEESNRDADYHERLARDYRAGLEEQAAARLKAETALADAASQRDRDQQMIRHLEAEVARSRAAADALRPKLGGPA